MRNIEYSNNQIKQLDQVSKKRQKTKRATSPSLDLEGHNSLKFELQCCLVHLYDDVFQL